MDVRSLRMLKRKLVVTMTKKKPNGCSNPIIRLERGLELLFKCEAEVRPRSLFCRYFEKSDKKRGSLCDYKTGTMMMDIMNGVTGCCICTEAIRDCLAKEGVHNDEDLKKVIMTTIGRAVDGLLEQEKTFQEEKPRGKRKRKS